jgi:2,4-dienoyl-CoA reductase-like NADH-dependent reductase (Old Yellow Enzyme family)
VKPHLFEPLELRGVTSRNRVVVSPMQQFMAKDGMPNDWHMVHLGQFAFGNAGIVFTEAVAVSARGRISYGDMGLWNRRQARAMARIVALIRSQGAVPAIQISHAGRRGATQRPWEGKQPLTAADAERGEPPWRVWGPSARPSRPGAQTPVSLTAAMIRRVQEAYVRSAKLADEAGFDVLELHGAHGYMIHSFLSPLSNFRTDAYGGPLGNRMRFALEVVEAVRAAWPQRKPLFFRVSAIDGVEGGWRIEDTVGLVRELLKRGVDVIDVSSGGLSGQSSNASAHARTPGYHVPLARRIREETGAMVQVVGLITEAGQADAILAEGSADLVAVAREALYDPYWAARASEKLGERSYGGWPAQYAWWLKARDDHLARGGQAKSAGATVTRR